MSDPNDDLPDLDKITDDDSADRPGSMAERVYGNTPNAGLGSPSEEDRCGAATRRGTPCKSPCVAGSNRCRMHGGSSPQVRAKAEREQHQSKINAKVEKAVRKFNINPVTDPLTELQTLAGEVLAWKDELKRHLHNLNSLRYQTDFNEQIRGEVLLYERALDRAVAVLATIAKLNIDERLAAVTESVASKIEAALFDSYDIVGIPITDPDKREEIAVAFGRHLTIAG